MANLKKGADPSEGDINISKRRKEWASKNLGARELELLEEDAKYFMHQALSTPCLTVLKACDGIYIEDISGKRYMDFHGNIVHNVGYKNQKIIDTIIEQLQTLPFSPRRFTNLPAIQLAKKLAEITPGQLGKSLFCPGGAEANGLALKIARGYTKRHKTISFWDSFHGATLDTISVGGEKIFRKDIGPLLPGTFLVPPPDCYRRTFGYDDPADSIKVYIELVKEVLEKEGDICAIIAEPIRSTFLTYSQDYWKAIRKLCDEHEALLIFDEIANDLGRTGKMFSCQNFDVTPDILVLGKSVGGGILPFAATVVRKDLDVFQDSALGHYTHEKNPVLASVFLKTIEIIEEEKLHEKAAKEGAYALEQFKEMMNTYELIGDVRGMGLLMAIELVKDRKTKERANEEAEDIMYRCLEKGLSFKLTMGNTITLTPPLTISREELDKAIDIIGTSILEVEKKRRDS